MGTPIIAFGQYPHHLRIVLLVGCCRRESRPSKKGALFVGLHGNTGQPRRA